MSSYSFSFILKLNRQSMFSIPAYIVFQGCASVILYVLYLKLARRVNGIFLKLYPPPMLAPYLDNPVLSGLHPALHLRSIAN